MESVVILSSLIGMFYKHYRKVDSMPTGNMDVLMKFKLSIVTFISYYIYRSLNVNVSIISLSNKSLIASF